MNQQEAKKLEITILTTLKKQLSQEETCIVGISGGPDSIFLLHFLKQIPCKTIVAHLNHQLRKEANDDQAFVEKICNNLTVESKKVDIKALSKGKNLEETGRNERYKFFKQLAKKHKATSILTAHHANDNLETIILNFTRGAGLQGLSGMQEIEELSTNLRLFRPLIDITKKEIEEYLKLKKILFRRDKSNKDLIFSRNFIRHKVIPALEKINPNLSKTISKNSQNLREVQNLIDQKAQNWLQKNRQSLNSKLFLKQPTAVQKAILLNLHKKIIGDNNNLKSIHLEEVLNLINNNTGNKEKKFGKLTMQLKNNIITLKK